MTELTIAPIGTCRIHTPLRAGVGHYPFTLSLGRNYGFVHTSSEAVQQIEFMLGKRKIPADVQTLVFRPSTPPAFSKKAHVPADMYFIEISSRKLLSVDGHPIQSNYAIRHYSDFFADRARAKMFWSLAAPQHLAERRKLLEQDAHFHKLAAADAGLLARIERRELEDGEIENEMARMVELLGKDKVVFVTHVNANTPDGTPIASRQRLIQTVRDIAKGLGAPCYDPTALMRETSQMTAMENDGLDLAHYTPLFAERICADLFKRFVRTRAAAAVADETSTLASARRHDELIEIEASWDAGRFLEASQHIHEALRREPARSDYRLLLGRMQYELGDYAGATGNLESARAELGPSEKADTLLMRAYFGTGEYAQARRLAAALLSDETETSEIMRISAVAATRMQDGEAALADWKRVFRLTEHKAEAADAILDLLAGDDEARAGWAAEVLEILPAHAGSLVTLWKHHIGLRDRARLLELARGATGLAEGNAIELANMAADAGFATPAAVLAAGNGVTHSKDPKSAAWTEKRANAWLQQGMAALMADKLLEAADNLQARWQIRPSGNPLIRSRRALEQKMRREVRQSFVEKDYEGAIRITAIARDTLLTFPELDHFLGRAADAIGDTPTALAHLKRAAEEEGAPVSTKIQLARVAARSEHYIEALAAYREILLDQPEETWARDEAARQLAKLETRAIRGARALLAEGSHDKAWALLAQVAEVNPDNQAARSEMKRVLGALRSQVKDLAADAAAERLRLGEAILRLNPQDEVGLKAAAVGAMRMHRFSDALPYWRALREKVGDPKLVDVNIQKCLLWIDRAQKRKAA
ncbi:hypothetical protein [Achromobacter aloeverae]